MNYDKHKITFDQQKNNSSQCVTFAEKNNENVEPSIELTAFMQAMEEDYLTESEQETLTGMIIW